MTLEFWHSCGNAAGTKPIRVPFYFAEINEGEVLQGLSRTVLEKESQLKREHRPARVAGEENIKDSLTSRYYAFNVLTWPEPCAQALLGFLRGSYRDMLDQLPLLRRQKVYIQCWANTVRNGESIKIHNHGGPGSYFSGNLPLQVCQPQSSFTHYSLNATADTAEANPEQRLSVDNLPGKLTIFPSHVYHYTDPWPHDEVRITVAFDIVPQAVVDRQSRYRVARKYIPFDEP